MVVNVHDGSHNPVPNAAVSVQWSGGFTGSATLTTDSSGRCTFVSGVINKNSPSATLTIANITHASLSYNASANHDPDGDSTGTTIVVNRP